MIADDPCTTLFRYTAELGNSSHRICATHHCTSIASLPSIRIVQSYSSGGANVHPQWILEPTRKSLSGRQARDLSIQFCTVQHRHEDHGTCMHMRSDTWRVKRCIIIIIIIIINDVSKCELNANPGCHVTDSTLLSSTDPFRERKTSGRPCISWHCSGSNLGQKM